MSDPRDIVDFTDINPEYVTYVADSATIPFDETAQNGSPHVGKAVRLDPADLTGSSVLLTAAGTPVLGKLILVERDGKCNVQTGGYCKLPRYTTGDAKTLPGAKLVGGTTAGTVVGQDATALAEVAVAAHKVVRREGASDVTVRLG